MKLQNLIYDGQVITVAVSDGRIAEIEVIRPADETDAANLLWLLPGLVGLHIHGRQPDVDLDGQEKPPVFQKEDWPHLIWAAIQGGYTTIVLMPNTSPPITSVKVLRCARSLVPKDCPYRPLWWFGATPTNGAEIQAARNELDVVGVKSFFGSSTGELLVKYYAEQLAVAKICARLGWPNAVHAEDDDLIAALLAGLGREPKIADHPDIRSEECEVRAVEQALRVGKESGSWMHICHVSTVPAADLIFAARAAGQRVSAETCPHYWRLNRDCLLLSDAAYYKMNPPLRAEATRRGIWERTVRGEFDTIDVDHAPHLEREKNGSEYKKVPSGIPGLQTLLPLALELVFRDQMSMADMIRCTSTWPARIIGLDRGTIKVGAVADLVLVDPRQQTEITNKSMAYKCGWTPFAGITTPGKVVATMIGGKLYYDVRQD